MKLNKSSITLLVVHTLALLYFFVLFMSRHNYEFIAYVAVILSFMGVILYSSKYIEYPSMLLWGLGIWSILHMSGGGLYFNDIKLYETMLVNIVGAPYFIFKYDQLVHMFGFGVFAIFIYYVLKPQLKKNHKWMSVAVVVVFAAMGAGALNEVIEFGTTLFDPNNGVGGYENTGLDLVSNMIGALFATLFIVFEERRK